MLHRKRIIMLAVVLVVAVGVWATAAGALVDQKVVLTGKVLSQGMAAPGTVVREGDILMVVDTITGPLPAARATLDGTVREVLVNPGDTVYSGDVVVRIESAR